VSECVVPRLPLTRSVDEDCEHVRSPHLFVLAAKFKLSADLAPVCVGYTAGLEPVLLFATLSLSEALSADLSSTRNVDWVGTSEVASRTFPEDLRRNVFNGLSGM